MADALEFRPRVLVVDRDVPETREVLSHLQDDAGMTAIWARDGEAALSILEDPEEQLHGMVCELKAQRIDGMRLLREALRRRPSLCVVMLSRRAELDAAVAATRAGAADFLTRPVDSERLLSVLRQGISRQQLSVRVQALEERLADRYGFERVVGRSNAVVELLGRLRQIAGTSAPVLLLGEPGTGKRLIAQLVHQNSPRRDEAFVELRCEGMEERLLETELFGRIEQAARGTLYLAEIAELPPRLQTRLLRLLREGGDAPGPRILASSSADLQDRVRRGKFRDDLLHALAAAALQVPPLRARREDIPLLTHALLEELNRAHGRKVTGVTRGCMDLLLQHSWPGNVRELKKFVSRLCFEGRDAITLQLVDQAIVVVMTATLFPRNLLV